MDKIRKIIREVLVEMSSRKNIQDISNLVLLTKTTLDSSGGAFLLYNPQTKTPVGYIGISHIPDINVFMVGGAYSEKGYGPLLYEIAMTYAYPNGLTLSQDGGTSRDAQNVWEKFVDRNDVKKEPIKKTKRSEKEEELINGCEGNPECLAMVKRTIELHNIKFSYSFGDNQLNNLIEIGREYANNNSISDDDIEHMLWDLE